MKLLCVHPGASFSTADVYKGMTEALKRRGHDIQEYRLDWRIEEANEYLNWQEERKKRAAKKEGREHTAPVGGIMPAIIRQASMTLLEATLTVNPHCVLIFSAMYLHPETMILMRRMGAPTVLLMTESPYDDAKQANIAPFMSYCYTNERASVKLMQRWHEQTKGQRGAKRIEYLPHAYDPDVHTPSYQTDDPIQKPARIEDVQVPRHDVVFVGSGFYERQETLQAIDWSVLGVDFGLYGKWPYVGTRNKLRQHIRSGVVPNEMTAALYRHAKIGLNLYRQSVGTSRNATRITGAESLNPRALELAAIGVPHISDYRPEVGEVFGDLVPTFKTPEGLEIEVQRLLADKGRREAMKQELPERVRGWTFDARAEQVEAGIAVARTGQP
jgi:hypothetical protein